MPSTLSDNVQSLEGKVLRWLSLYNPRLRLVHLWCFAPLIPGATGFAGFFCNVVSFHLDGNFDETNKPLLFWSILAFGILPCLAVFYLTFKDVNLPLFLLLLQITQLGFAFSISVLSFLIRGWWLFTPCMILILLPALAGWCYGLFCFQRMRQVYTSTSRPHSRGVQAVFVASFGGEARDGLLSQAFLAQGLDAPSTTNPLKPNSQPLSVSTSGPSRRSAGEPSSVRTSDMSQRSALASDPGEIMRGQTAQSSENRPLTSGVLTTSYTDALTRSSIEMAAPEDILFEPNLAFVENFMPICTLYGYAILVLAGFELIMNAFLTPDIEILRKIRQQWFYAFGFILPILELISIMAFVAWSTRPESIAPRAYSFVFIQLLMIIAWGAMSERINFGPLRVGLSTNIDRVSPFLIFLDMTICALHVLFFIHFGFYWLFKRDFSGERIMLH